MSLIGELIAITGAASGIGRATAVMLAQRGTLLSLADVNASALDALRIELEEHYETWSASLSTSISQASSPDIPGVHPKPILTTVCDVSSRSACDAWIAATRAHFESRPLAGVANLAGIIGSSVTQGGGLIRNLSDAEFNRVMLVNCSGIWNSLRAELPAMRIGGSSIVNAASIAGLVGVEANAPYVASKHAVIGLTRTLAKEEGKNGIRCNAIAPGIIATPMMAQIELAKGSTDLFGDGDPGALRRKGSAEEVAQVIAFLLSSESSFVNGAVIPVDGGWIC